MSRVPHTEATEAWTRLPGRQVSRHPPSHETDVAFGLLLFMLGLVAFVYTSIVVRREIRRQPDHSPNYASGDGVSNDVSSSIQGLLSFLISPRSMDRKDRGTGSAAMAFNLCHWNLESGKPLTMPGIRLPDSPTPRRQQQQKEATDGTQRAVCQSRE